MDTPKIKEQVLSTDSLWFQIVISTCVVAAAMAYPYPMPVPSPIAMALAFPDHAPSYHAPPPKYEPPVHVPVHKGYEEVLGRVKMQVGVNGSYAGGVLEC